MILTATRRLARELKGQHDWDQKTAGHHAWQTAPIEHLPDWLAERWKEWLYSGRAETVSRPLREAEERIIWDDIIRSYAHHLPLNVPEAAALALASWELLCEWNLSLDAAEWRSSADSRAFQSWAREFLHHCQKNQWFSRAELPGIVADLIERGQVAVPRHVEIAGFLEPTPSQQRVFDALTRRGTVIRKRTVPDLAHSAVRFAGTDARLEIRAAAEWARRMLEKNPEAVNPPFRIGVIVPDLDQMRSEIERVFGETFHPNIRLQPERDPERLFNISLGLPASAYPVIQAALHILTTNPHKIPIEIASRLLRSPFTSVAEEEYTSRALLDVAVRALGEPHVSLGDIVKLAARKDAAYGCPRLVSQLRSWSAEFEVLPTRQLPSKWAGDLSKYLKSTGWPGNRALSSIEHQTLEVWKDLLSELAGLDSVCGHIRLNAATGMLRQLASDKLFQPKSEPAPVQIMGVYEASGLSFDRLWIMGMHDNAWPTSSAPYPFVPFRLQRRFGLPRSLPDLQLEHARILTARLLSSAPTIVVSFPKRHGDANLRVSPLFAGLPEVSAVNLGILAHDRYVEQLQRSSLMETLEDNHGPPCSDFALRGGTALFKLQAACPFKAFAELRLKAKAPDLPEPGLSAIDRGKLIHRILERVWKQLRSHDVLLAMSEDQLADIVRLSVRSAIKNFSSRRRALQKPRFAAIEQARLEHIVGAWLALEKERQPFTMLEQEEEQRVTVGGIDTRIRIDRIDRLENGDRIILDYKTGDCQVSHWTGDRPDEPQVPIYAVAANAPLAGVFFGSLKVGEARFKGLAQSPGIVPGVTAPPDQSPLSHTVDTWRDVLNRLGRDYSAGRAIVDPKNRNVTCRYCALPMLCRIGQTSTQSEPDDG